MSLDKKQLMFIECLYEIITIFGESEVGSTEIDSGAVLSYLNSGRAFVDMFDFKTKEDVEQYLTNQILNGLPIWNFLKLSPWTREMVRRSFVEESEARNKRLREMYKCYQNCHYYEQFETSFGTFIKCKKTGLGGDSFKPKKRCRFYRENIQEGDSVVR